jgi:amino acid permease
MRKWEKLPGDNDNHRQISLKYHKNNIINDYDHNDLITINFNDDVNTITDDKNDDNNNNENNENNSETNNATVLGATMNFINSIVGAGIIGIPFAISQTGFFMGIILLVLIAYLINRSVIMLIECGLQKHKLNLEELCEHLLGTKGYYLALSSMMMFAYGGMIAYLVIFGDTMPFVIQTVFNSQNIILSRESVMIISATFIILPLCLMKKIESLEWTSSFSVLSDIILVLILAIGAPIAAKNQGIVLDMSQLVFARSTMVILLLLLLPMIIIIIIIIKIVCWIGYNVIRFCLST